ncbi:hypothetical protein ScPMuIL_006343 [Solemya velum]
MKNIYTQDELDDILKKAKTKLVVVDFWAEWCGPCKFIGPVFDKLSGDSKYKNKVVFVKVDVDEASELAEYVGIQCMPTFVFFKNKEKIDEMAGANKDSLHEMIETHSK